MIAITCVFLVACVVAGYVFAGYTMKQDDSLKSTASSDAHKDSNFVAPLPKDETTEASQSAVQATKEQIVPKVSQPKSQTPQLPITETECEVVALPPQTSKIGIVEPQAQAVALIPEVSNLASPQPVIQAIKAKGHNASVPATSEIPTFVTPQLEVQQTISASQPAVQIIEGDGQRAPVIPQFEVQTLELPIAESQAAVAAPSETPIFVALQPTFQVTEDQNASVPATSEIPTFVTPQPEAQPTILALQPAVQVIEGDGQHASMVPQLEVQTPELPIAESQAAAVAAPSETPTFVALQPAVQITEDQNALMAAPSEVPTFVALKAELTGMVTIKAESKVPAPQSESQLPTLEVSNFEPLRPAVQAIEAEGQATALQLELQTPQGTEAENQTSQTPSSQVPTLVNPQLQVQTTEAESQAAAAPPQTPEVTTPQVSQPPSFVVPEGEEILIEPPSDTAYSKNKPTSDVSTCKEPFDETSSDASSKEF